MVINQLNQVKHLNRRIRLLVAGKGKKPRNVPDNVTFVGLINDIEQIYAASDLFLFLPLYEPSANVVIEALASCLPVITTRQNGAADWIVTGENGNIVDSPLSIDETVQCVINWMGKDRIMVTAADLRKMSLERNVEETLIVLEQAAQEKST